MSATFDKLIGKLLLHKHSPSDAGSPVVTVGTSNADYIVDGTADDVQIQQAVDAVEAAGGGTVVLKKATYAISASIVITKSNVTLQGTGWGSKLVLNNSVNDYVIKFVPDASNFIKGTTIHDLAIDCNGANQTAGGGIYGDGAVWCTFDRLWFDEPYNNGIYLLDDNLGNFGHHNVISKCLFENGENAGASGAGRAILLDQSDENTVIGCTFQGNGRSDTGEPNHVFDKAGLNTIISNHFVTGQTGVKVQGSHSRVIGNTFDGCQNHLMRVNGSKNIIEGNTFYNIGFGSSSGNIDGLRIDNVQFNTITGNFFFPYATTAGCRCGISLDVGPATNNLVTGNTFSTLDGGSFGTAEIVVGAGSGNIITANKPTTYDAVATSRGAVLDGGVVINEPGAAKAFRVESDNDSELISIASDRDGVGIGHSVPDDKLDVEGNLRVRDNASSTTKAYRLRTSGGALDFEAGGAGLYLSTWSGAGFTGTQYNQIIFANDGSNIAAQRDMTVPDEAYGSGWNANLEVPTKNAVYDEMETRVKDTGDTMTGNLNLNYAGSGSAVQFSAINTSNTASSYAIFYAEVAGSSAADPMFQFSVDGVTDWVMGADNSDSDKFKIDVGTTLGSDTALSIDTSKLTTINKLKVIPAANGTDIFQVTNAAGSTYLISADSSNTKVGINTSAPDERFHVAGSGTETFFMWVGSTGGSRMGFSTKVDLTNEVGYLECFKAGVGNRDMWIRAASIYLDSNADFNQELLLDSNGNVVVGTAALATNATNKFLYIPTCAGTPTGTPTSYSGRAPIVYDTTNNKLYVYNGAWKSATFA